MINPLSFPYCEWKWRDHFCTRQLLININQNYFRDDKSTSITKNNEYDINLMASGNYYLQVFKEFMK